MSNEDELTICEQNIVCLIQFYIVLNKIGIFELYFPGEMRHYDKKMIVLFRTMEK